MNLFAQVRHLIYKDMLLEWRSRYAINGILLYVVSTIFVCYQAFKSLDATTWNVLFWIILLFAAINATSKSFTQESPSRQLYYYTIAGGKAVILAKIIYSSLLLVVLSLLAFTVYGVIFGRPVENQLLYLATVFLGGLSFATVFTMVSGISAQAGNNVTLMSILAFPIVIPLLIVLIQLSSKAMVGVGWNEVISEISVLLAINIITIAISLLLFPYLWRE